MAIYKQELNNIFTFFIKKNTEREIESKQLESRFVLFRFKIVIFYRSLALASSTIGLHIGKSCFRVFSKFKCELAVYIQEVYEMWLVAMATEVVVFFFIFSLVCGLVYPQESRYFSKCSILALEKRYLGKD